MLFLRPSDRGSRLGPLLVLVLAFGVLPTVVLPSLYHQIACHLLSPPHCTTCLSGMSAATAPDAAVAARPLLPIGIIFAAGIVETDSVPAGPLGGRSPPLAG
jgi:hypothetical protein